MIPRKRHLVATLFYGDLMAENLTLPKDREWKPIEEIVKDVKGPGPLVWGKDDKGNINQLFYFNKSPHWYYAHVAE